MNDGMPFRPQDWQRLKKIAEGNPDEEKIGAYVLGRTQTCDVHRELTSRFGVGFYSLWSVCGE